MGFVSTRLSALGGGLDVIKTQGKFAKETLGTATSEGSPGLLGIMRDTGKAAGRAIGGAEQGVLRAKGTKLNPLDEEGFFNPMRIARRVAAGTTEVIAESTGGLVGLISERVGNNVKGTIRGLSRMTGGVIFGDYGKYLGGNKSTVNTARMMPKKAPKVEPAVLEKAPPAEVKKAA